LQYYSEQIKTIQESTKRTSCRESIQALLLNHESENTFTLEYCAKHLHISTSTLKRRLKAEGTSFNQVVQETKFFLAKQYLSNETIPLSEIAYLLGFSDNSALSRAFKKWSGVSPLSYKAKKKSPNSMNSG